MEKIILRKVDKDEFGRIEPQLRETTYFLKYIAMIQYGKMKDFHSKEDIVGNGMDEDESCLFITFTTRDKYGDIQTATFGSEWEVTFE